MSFLIVSNLNKVWTFIIHSKLNRSSEHSKLFSKSSRTLTNCSNSSNIRNDLSVFGIHKVFIHFSNWSPDSVYLDIALRMQLRHWSFSDKGISVSDVIEKNGSNDSIHPIHISKSPIASRYILLHTLVCLTRCLQKLAFPKFSFIKQYQSCSWIVTWQLRRIMPPYLNKRKVAKGRQVLYA
jgi:hypothetical protein